MAPLDSLLNLPSSRYQRDRFFDELDVGDVYCCTISSVAESGISMILLCHSYGKIREIEHLKISVSFATFNFLAKISTDSVLFIMVIFLYELHVVIVCFRNTLKNDRKF